MLQYITKKYSGIEYSYTGDHVSFDDQYLISSLSYVLEYNKKYSIVEAIETILDHFDDIKVLSVLNNIIACNTEDYYLDYFNNFLTVEKFSDHYGINTDYAADIIHIGRLINHKRNGRTLPENKIIEAV